MSNLVIKEFHGSGVRFETRDDGKVWGCLTDMSKVTNKQVPDYMRLLSTQELLSVLGEDSIQVKRGRNGGTWAIEEVVLDFAYWSNLEFRLWTIKAVKDLLTTGIATAQRFDESLEDYQKREAYLKAYNQCLLAWSPRMSFPKLRYLEMIGYTPSDHSPFLKPKEQLREYLYSPQSDWDVREGRIVQDLVDTLFEPGTKINVDTYRFPDIESLLNYIPSRFYSLCVNSPYTNRPQPRKGFEQFQGSIKVKHNNLSEIWLEFMPKKREQLESYLNSPQDLAIV